MSEWIKVHAGVFTHPKTRRLAKRLSISPAAAAGHMACLWSFTAEFAPDGDLSRFDAEEVELGAGWDGEDGLFVAAATASGYLEDGGGRLTVHDWMDWGGTLVVKRAKERERASNRREAASSGAYEAVKRRDGEACRYCGKTVNWNDRRSDDGATYDHVDPDGPASIENLVVACRGCNSTKGHRSPSQAGMTLIVVGADTSLVGPNTDPERTKADRQTERQRERTPPTPPAAPKPVDNSADQERGCSIEQETTDPEPPGDAEAAHAIASDSATTCDGSPCIVHEFPAPAFAPLRRAMLASLHPEQQKEVGTGGDLDALLATYAAHVCASCQAGLGEFERPQRDELCERALVAAVENLHGAQDVAAVMKSRLLRFGLLELVGDKTLAELRATKRDRKKKSDLRPIGEVVQVPQAVAP